MFIVVERGKDIVGTLFAATDGLPVAWVRVATLDDQVSIDEWLDLSLPVLLEGLRHHGTQTVAWMDWGAWAGTALEARGFRRLADVITLAKHDRALPKTPLAPAQVRPVTDDDAPAIVTIDRAAFTAHWWHTEATQRQRISSSLYFVVAEVEGAVAGYADGDLHPPRAHLNRLAVHPAYQGRGIGASLLHHALQTFWRGGATEVSLNTQTENLASQRLYRRFGFVPTGDVMTAWELAL
jgi:ribosomal protein S18 acetylase RimI-like enzyme